MTQFTERKHRPFLIDPEHYNDKQSTLMRRILSGPRGEAPPNLLIWMHNPEFAEVAERFGAYVSQLSALSKRHREIIILVVAHYWQSGFEWYWHEIFAEKAGILPAQIQAIGRGDDPAFTDPQDRVVYDLCQALHRHRRVDDALHARAMACLGHAGVADVIGVIGLYTMIAHTIRVYDVPYPGETQAMPWQA